MDCVINATREKKVAPGTRYAAYRCSLPGLAGFSSFTSPRAIWTVALLQLTVNTK
jgi:hypothetical protein